MQKQAVECRVSRPRVRDLPIEIFFQIGQYLTQPQLEISSLVCKSWHSAFGPQFWSHLKLESHNPSSSIDILHKRAPWIHSLELENHQSIMEFSPMVMQCRNLRSLSITSTCDESHLSKEYMNACRNIIKQTRKTLDSLTIKRMSFPESKSKYHRPNWGPLLSFAYYPHSNLRSLKLFRCILPYRHLVAFWKICERLEVLDLEDVPFELPRSFKIHTNLAGITVFTPIKPNPSSDHQQLTVDFSNLLELTLNRSGPQNSMITLEHIVRKAPKLRKLKWIIRDESWSPKDRFLYLLTAKPKYCRRPAPLSVPFTIPLEPCTTPCWPDLMSLDFRRKYKGKPYLECEEFQDVLDTLTNMTFLDILSAFYPITWTMAESLVRLHSHTLTTLRMPRFHQSVSKEIQLILSNCPKLAIVSIASHVQDFIEGAREWVCCESLEELTITLSWELGSYNPPRRELTDEETQSQSWAVFEQFARFRNIRVLEISQYLNSYENHSKLQFNLNMGLSLLSELISLEILKACQGNQTMTPNDVNWIIKHFVSLRVLHVGKLTTFFSGYLSRPCLWECELATMLNNRGIKTPGTELPIDFKSRCDLDWTHPGSEPVTDDQEITTMLEFWGVFGEGLFE
ncbi:hypothetical protein BGZ76_009095 [Entomortierella beljakovae]|nr:hypothetical protein BGZ76_009095 [Entomortierella beljakovae]